MPKLKYQYLSCNYRQTLGLKLSIPLIPVIKNVNISHRGLRYLQLAQEIPDPKLEKKFAQSQTDPQKPPWCTIAFCWRGKRLQKESKKMRAVVQRVASASVEVTLSLSLSFALSGIMLNMRKIAECRWKGARYHRLGRACSSSLASTIQTLIVMLNICM